MLFGLVLDFGGDIFGRRLVLVQDLHRGIVRATVFDRQRVHRSVRATGAVQVLELHHDCR